MDNMDRRLFISSRQADFVFDFHGRTVLLGANGSGKSSLLREIRDSFRLAERVLFVEGGRALKLVDRLHVDASNFGYHAKLETAERHYESKLHGNLAERVTDALFVLQRIGETVRIRHSKECQEWDDRGRIGEMPKVERSPMDVLCDQFSRIFPGVSLEFNQVDSNFSAAKNGRSYSISNLSDGEKQVFCMLADTYDLSRQAGVVIVDEPELNLHPALAEQLWEMLEDQYPSSTFIYATHHVGFALRSGVDQVFVLGRDGRSIARMDRLAALARDDAMALLGRLPGLVAVKEVLVVEGDDKSLDKAFYEWVLGKDASAQVLPVGSCNSVVQVTRHLELWRDISPTARITGVVDKDFGNEASDGIVVSPFREVESFLCIPEVAVAVASHLRLVAPIPSSSMIEELIFETLAQRRVELAAKTVAAQFRAVATIALDKSVLKPADESAAREHLVLEASRAVLQVNEIFGESRVKGALQDQLARIDACLSERKVLSALALLPAKLVATAVAKMCGAPDPRAMMRSLSSNFSPNDFQAIRELRAAVTVENRANDAPPTVVTAPPSELLLVAREQMAVRLPAFRMLRANALTDEQILSAVRESPDLKAAAVKLAGKQVASETIQDHRHSPVNVIRSQLGLAPLL